MSRPVSRTHQASGWCEDYWDEGDGQQEQQSQPEFSRKQSKSNLRILEDHKGSEIEAGRSGLSIPQGPNDSGANWGTMVSFGKNLFASGVQHKQAISGMIFGVGSHCKDPSEPQSHLLKPLLAFEAGSPNSRGHDYLLEPESRRSLLTAAKQTLSAIPAFLPIPKPAPQMASSPISTPSPTEPLDESFLRPKAPVATGLSFSSSAGNLSVTESPQGSSSTRQPAAIAGPSLSLPGVLGSAGRSPDSPLLFPSRPSSSSQSHPSSPFPYPPSSPPWLLKVMEVLPVLAVVFLTVLFTVLYLTIVDEVIPSLRPAFSLSCRVEHGDWVRSSSRTSSPYPASCPYIRDRWNCAKYGAGAAAPRKSAWGGGKSGSSAVSQLRWEPRDCHLPDFSALRFLQQMRGRRMAFVGDSSAANSFDSMLCMLAQGETPTRVPGAVKGLLKDDADTGEVGIWTQPGSLPVTQGSGTPQADMALGLRGQAGPVLPVANVPRGSAGAIGLHGGWGHKWGVFPFGRTGRVGGTEEGVEGVDVMSGAEGEEDVAADRAAEAVTSGSDARLSYHFPAHNFTLTLFHSRFLVRAVRVVEKVNSTACQLSKVASAAGRARGGAGEAAHGKYRDVISGEAVSGGSGDGLTEGSDLVASGSSTNTTIVPNSNSTSTPSSSPTLPSPLDVCYPNRVQLDEPDPLWASEAASHDVLVLDSGAGWTEEMVEKEGLGIFLGGSRRADLSMEGLQGGWAFPVAMAAVAEWLRNATNFGGHAIFRSFSPGHSRRECASRAVLGEEKAMRLRTMEDAWRFDNATAFALSVDRRDQKRSGTWGHPQAAASANAGLPLSAQPRLRFLNITLLSAERGDGHPWMFSPARPKADCTHWCLPGVPDTWNEILAATLLELFR